MFEVGFAGGCAEGGIAESGMATSAGDTSVELVWSCLHFWDHQRNVVVCFTLDATPILDEISWLAWMPFFSNTRFVRTIVTARVQRVILSIIELEQTCPTSQT